MLTVERAEVRPPHLLPGVSESAQHGAFAVGEQRKRPRRVDRGGRGGGVVAGVQFGVRRGAVGVHPHVLHPVDRPGGGVDRYSRRRAPSAEVTNTASPHTAGLETPVPSSGAVQARSSTVKLSGKTPAATPAPSGPRNRGHCRPRSRRPRSSRRRSSRRRASQRRRADYRRAGGRRGRSRPSATPSATGEPRAAGGRRARAGGGFGGTGRSDGANAGRCTFFAPPPLRNRAGRRRDRAGRRRDRRGRRGRRRGRLSTDERRTVPPAGRLPRDPRRGRLAGSVPAGPGGFHDDRSGDRLPRDPRRRARQPRPRGAVRADLRRRRRDVARPRPEQPQRHRGERGTGPAGRPAGALRGRRTGRGRQPPDLHPRPRGPAAGGRRAGGRRVGGGDPRRRAPRPPARRRGGGAEDPRPAAGHPALRPCPGRPRRRRSPGRRALSAGARPGFRPRRDRRGGGGAGPAARSHPRGHRCRAAARRGGARRTRRGRRPGRPPPRRPRGAAAEPRRPPGAGGGAVPTGERKRLPGGAGRGGRRFSPRTWRTTTASPAATASAGCGPKA